MLANPTPFWHSWIAILVVTPLISMSQSTLGLHFVVFTAVLSGITWLRTGSRLRALTTLVALQLAILLLLRTTLLAATDQNFYQPTFSLQNIMQFRGIELYVGFRITYVVAASILFLLVISQLLAGVWLADHKSDSDRRILGLLAAVGVSSLILANLFSIGSQEAQQARFLIPLITLGTFFSLCLSLRHVNRIWTLQTRSARIWAPAILIMFVFGSVSLYGKYVAFDLPWSQLRTLAIGLMIASAQLILVLLVVLRRRWSGKNFSSVLIVCMLLATTLTADGRQIRELIGLHQSSVSASRAELIIGGSGAKRCLEFVRANTPENEIIASNWQRIPLALRDSKYFLVSATVERRTYVDGPNYVGYPRDGRLPGWLESRVNVVDGFAERVDPQSFAELRAAGIRYFLVDARESPAGDWQPFADIVVETDACYVLKLRV